jgi:hypothetical protein
MPFFQCCGAASFCWGSGSGSCPTIYQPDFFKVNIVAGNFSSEFYCYEIELERYSKKLLQLVTFLVIYIHKTSGFEPHRVVGFLRLRLRNTAFFYPLPLLFVSIFSFSLISFYLLFIALSIVYFDTHLSFVLISAILSLFLSYLSFIFFCPIL